MYVVGSSALVGSEAVIVVVAAVQIRLLLSFRSPPLSPALIFFSSTTPSPAEPVGMVKDLFFTTRLRSMDTFLLVRSQSATATLTTCGGPGWPVTDDLSHWL